MSALDPVRVVEAALFSSGRPMLDEEIAQATQLPRRAVVKALAALQAEYSQSHSALEVARGGQKWAMQIKGRYSERARMLAKMEVPVKVLKTLALIAFHQPIKQSELKDMVGSAVYDHVHELHDRGMIASRQEGVTKVLTTSARFPEYFGLEATDRDQIRTLLAQRVGIDASRLRRVGAGQTILKPPSDTAEVAEVDAPQTAEQADATNEPLKATTS